MATAKRVIQIDVTTTASARKAVQDLNRRLRSIEGNSERAARSLKKMGSNINFMGLAAKAYIAIRFTRYIKESADAITLLGARIALVADGTRNLTEIMDDLFTISEQSRSSIEATGILYQRLALSSKELGLTHTDLLNVTEALSSALLLSGANAQEAKSIMIQYSQALAKGKLDGDEFRSISENAAVVMDLLAKNLGVTRGELFELSKAGKLTGRVMTEALGDNVDELRENIANMPVTFDQAFVHIENAWSKLMFNFRHELAGTAKFIKDGVGGIVNAFVEGLSSISSIGIQEGILRDLTNQRDELFSEIDARIAQFERRPTRKRLESIKEYLEPLTERLKSVNAEINATQAKLEELRGPISATDATGPSGTPVSEEERANKTIKAIKEVLTWQEEFRNSIVATQTDIDRYAEKINILDNLYFDGAISLEVYNQKLEELAGTITENVVPATEDWSEAMKNAIAQSTVDAVGQMTDAFVDFALTGKQSFRELTASILADISKMILRMVVLNTLKSAFAGTSFGNFLFPTGTPSFATGTPYVPQDGLAYLHKGERVVPASQNTVTNNNNYTTERPISIVNVTDPGQIGEIMGGSVGEEVVINHIRRNPDLIRQVLS